MEMPFFNLEVPIVRFREVRMKMLSQADISKQPGQTAWMLRLSLMHEND